jgi:hypothetical protein
MDNNREANLGFRLDHYFILEFSDNYHFYLAKTAMIATPVDCFVLVLLSHGTEDILITDHI